MAAGTSAIITAAIIDSVVCIISFLIFSYMRLRVCCEKFYAAKLHMPLQRGLWARPRQIARSFFGWMPVVWNYPEPKIIFSAGLDTAMYLRVFTFGNQLFLFVSLWCCILLLPINITGDEVDYLMSNPSPPPPSLPDAGSPPPASSQEYELTSFDKLSLTNVPPESHRMWAHLISVYVVSLFCLWLLWKYSKESVILRIMFLGNSSKTGATHTVLIQDIPGVGEATGKVIAERKKSEKAAREASKLAAKSPQSKATDSSSGKDEAAAEKDATISPAAAAAAPSSSTSASPEGKKLEAPPLRRRKFAYNLDEPTLHPKHIATEILESGVSPKDMVEAEMNMVYPNGAVAAVNMVYDQTELTKLVAEYEAIKLNLEDFIDSCKFKMENGKEVKRPKCFIMPGAMGPWGKEKYGGGWIKRVDALEFWVCRLRELDEQIAVQQALSREVAKPSAFVTFHTRRDQAICASALHQHEETTWVTQNAPAAFELIWKNLGLTLAYRSPAEWTMWVVFWLMTFFFMIPVLAVQGLIETAKVDSLGPLSTFLQNVVVSKLLEAIVPGLALKIFLAIVPMLLNMMMDIQGVTCLSLKDFGVVSRYFIFQVVVVFVFNTIGSAFFNQVQQWIDDPGSVVTILGSSIPMSATFFITYIWISGLMTKPIGLIRIPGLAMFWIFSKLAGSPQAAERVWQNQYTTLGATAIDHTITIMLGLIFCCINPIIAPSCLAYFVVNTFIERYINIYVTRRQYESGGQLWQRIFHQVMVGLYIFQLVMIGLLSIKKFPYSPIIIPMILITVGFHFAVASLFRRPWVLMALHDAAELDRVDKEVAAGKPLLAAVGEFDNEEEEAEAAKISAASTGVSKAVDPEAPVDLKDVEIGVAPSERVGTLVVHIEPPEVEYLSPVFKIVKGAVDDLMSEAEEIGSKIDEQDLTRPAKGKKSKASDKYADGESHEELVQG